MDEAGIPASGSTWKFCLPLNWLVHGLVVHLLWALVALAVTTLLLALLGLVSGTMQTAAAVLFLAGLVCGWGSPCGACTPIAYGAAAAVAGGVFGGHGHGQLVPLAVGVHQGDALAWNRLPGGLAGPGDQGEQ